MECDPLFFFALLGRASTLASLFPTVGALDVPDPMAALTAGSAGSDCLEEFDSVFPHLLRFLIHGHLPLCLEAEGLLAVSGRAWEFRPSSSDGGESLGQLWIIQVVFLSQRLARIFLEVALGKGLVLVLGLGVASSSKYTSSPRSSSVSSKVARA